MTREEKYPGSAQDVVDTLQTTTLWLAVGWYMVAGALFGGMYGCGLLAAMILGGLVSEGWRWAACLSVATVGATLGWILLRKIIARPPLRLAFGILAAFALPGVILFPLSLVALFWGVFLGVAYGLTVGFVDVILVLAVVRTRYFHPDDVRRWRRAIVAANLLGVGVIPSLWIAWWVNSTLRVDPAAQSSASSTLLSLFVFAIVPALILLPVAEHVGNRLTDSTASAMDEKSES